MLAFTSQIMQAIGKPQEENLENKMSLFNEFMATIYLYTLLTLTDYNGPNSLKAECGVFLLGIVLFTIAVNILKVLI
jgi:hypothetical protein